MGNSKAAGHIVTVNGDAGDALVGQAGIHGIMEYDLIGLVGVHIIAHSCGNNEGHFITDIMVSGVLSDFLTAKGIVNVLNLLHNGRRIILLADFDVAIIGDLQQSQVLGIMLAAQIGSIHDQPVTSCQIHSFCGNDGGLNIGQIVVSNLSQGVGFRALVSLALQDLGNICRRGAGIKIIVVCLQLCQQSGTIDTIAPVNLSQCGIIVSLGTLKYLVSIIGMARSAVGNICCKCSGCQSHDQHQCQCHSKQFLYIFHNDFPFITTIGIWNLFGNRVFHREDSAPFLRLFI